jgi:hypothetical protein
MTFCKRPLADAREVISVVGALASEVALMSRSGGTRMKLTAHSRDGHLMGQDGFERHSGSYRTGSGQVPGHASCDTPDAPVAALEEVRRR